MAFNTLEYLENGNVDFVYDLSTYDYKNLIKYVRANERKTEIINGFLPKLKDTRPNFCFEIIFDNDLFYDDAKYLFETYYTIDTLTKEQIETMILNSKLGKEIFEEYFEQLLVIYKDDLDFVFEYLFSDIDKNIVILKSLAYHSNLHLRFLFMKYLLEHKLELISMFYEDISKYLTSETFQENEQLSFIHDNMPMKDVCELAYMFFDKKIDYQTWEKMKQFILTNYQYNELATRLLGLKKQYFSSSSYRFVDNKEGIEEFNRDADLLFATSANYRFNILNRYSAKVSQTLLDDYRRHLQHFYRDGKVDDVYKRIEFYGLGRTVEQYVDKYLSMSTRHECTFLEAGSTSSCYRIGDYVFKLDRTKWSYEQVICPDLYLILPNIEEVFIRNDKGVVLSGIEVQRYLSRSAKHLPMRLFTTFSKELERLGYYTSDTLINGVCGDNCRLLNSYKESGNPNPPAWFKMFPIVLVDRDRVYRLENKCPKQLREGY